MKTTRCSASVYAESDRRRGHQSGTMSSGRSVPQSLHLGLSWLQAKLEAIESLEPALCTAEAELAETKDALDKSQNALMDCQEMLEELQAFGEKQEAELMAMREELHVS